MFFFRSSSYSFSLFSAKGEAIFDFSANFEPVYWIQNWYGDSRQQTIVICNYSYDNTRLSLKVVLDIKGWIFWKIQTIDSLPFFSFFFFLPDVIILLSPNLCLAFSVKKNKTAGSVNIFFSFSAFWCRVFSGFLCLRFCFTFSNFFFWLLKVYYCHLNTKNHKMNVYCFQWQ